MNAVRAGNRAELKRQQPQRAADSLDRYALSDGLARDEEPLARKANHAAIEANAGAAWSRATSGGGGEVPYRREMERAFGQDFSGVKAHVGRKAEMGAIQAKAATVGESVAFAETQPDKRLVAHELTHVVQNRRAKGGGGLRKKTSVSKPGDAAEVEADRVAAQICSSGKVQHAISAGSVAVASSLRRKAIKYKAIRNVVLRNVNDWKLHMGRLRKHHRFIGTRSKWLVRTPLKDRKKKGKKVRALWIRGWIHATKEQGWVPATSVKRIKAFRGKVRRHKNVKFKYPKGGPKGKYWYRREGLLYRARVPIVLFGGYRMKNTLPEEIPAGSLVGKRLFGSHPLAKSAVLVQVLGRETNNWGYVRRSDLRTKAKWIPKEEKLR